MSLLPALSGAQGRTESGLPGRLVEQDFPNVSSPKKVSLDFISYAAWDVKQRSGTPQVSRGFAACEGGR
jgi:hypothetical protein